MNTIVLAIGCVNHAKPGCMDSIRALYHVWAGVFMREVVEHAHNFVRTPAMTEQWSQRTGLSIIHVAHHYRQKWASTPFERDSRVVPWLFDNLTDIISAIEEAIPHAGRWKGSVQTAASRGVSG